MACCRPKLPPCAAPSCRQCTVPTVAFHGDHLDLAEQQCVSSNGVLSAVSDVMRHNEPFLLATGTYYAFNGAFLLHLASHEAIGFSSSPLMPPSAVFYWRASKLPVMGAVAPDGSLPYQSAGPVVREGDTILLSPDITPHAVAQYGYPSPANLPRAITPLTEAIRNFTLLGTGEGSIMRIVSDEFNPLLPHNQQPPVRLDGTRAYYFQFTRTAQNLSVIPGQFPAPCMVKTSNFKGDSTRLIPLAPASLFEATLLPPLAPPQQPPIGVVAVVSPPPVLPLPVAATARANGSIGTAAATPPPVVPTGSSAARPLNQIELSNVDMANAAAAEAVEASNAAKEAAREAVNASRAGQAAASNSAANRAQNAANAARQAANAATQMAASNRAQPNSAPMINSTRNAATNAAQQAAFAAPSSANAAQTSLDLASEAAQRAASEAVSAAHSALASAGLGGAI